MPSNSLLGLPSELRLEIFDWVFRSTILYTERNPWIEFTKPNDSIPPKMSHQLNLVCRIFDQEIGTSWHPRVTYYFPSTVAFIDVLAQWTTKSVHALRHVIVKATPVPLDLTGNQRYDPLFLTDAVRILAYKPFLRHSATCDVLTMGQLFFFPGLQLDTLTVESLWAEALERQILVKDISMQYPRASEQVGEEEIARLITSNAVYNDLLSLLTSGRWRELQYIAEPLELRIEQLRALEQTAERIKADPNEKTFRYSIDGILPNHGPKLIRNRDNSYTRADEPEDGEELAQWLTDHPANEEESTPLRRPTKQVVLWARRGADASYIQPEDVLLPKTAGIIAYAGEGRRFQTPYGNRWTYHVLRANLLNDGVDTCWEHAPRRAYIPYH